MMNHLKSDAPAWVVENAKKTINESIAACAVTTPMLVDEVPDSNFENEPMKKVIFSSETFNSVLMCIEWELGREKDILDLGGEGMEESIAILERVVADLKNAEEVHP